MKTQFTKGRWSIAKDRDGLFIDSDSGMICEINHRQPLQEANAKLIADAGTTSNKCGLLPSELLKQRNELLEAIETIMEINSGKRSGGANHIYKIANEVIQKATK